MSEPQAPSTEKPEVPEGAAEAQLPGTEAQEAEAASETPPRPARRGGGNAIAIIALLAAAGALGGGYYLWQQLQQTRAALASAEVATAERLGELRSGLEGTIRRQGESLMATAGEADSRTEARVAELSQAVEHLRESVGRDADAWVAAEVEHLLRIANARLQLAHDVTAAIVALETADQRLTALGDPAYTPVREAIARELHALRETGEADQAGIALKLTGLIEAIERLPIAGPYAAAQPQAAPTEAAEAPPEVSDWREFLGAVWADIRGLVTIRRAEQGAVSALLPPSERYFLRQNLRLKLETARLALLNRNGELYHAALDEAADWLQTYFAADTPPVGEAVTTVTALRKVAVEPTLPDISGSLRTLDRIARRLQQAGKPESRP